MARVVRKTTIVWTGERFREVEKELDRFKARAVGARLRELALLGLLAERAGYRVDTASGDPTLAGGQPILLAEPPAEPVAPPVIDEDPDPRASAFTGQFGF